MDATGTPMRTFLPMTRGDLPPLPPELADDDVRYPEALVETFLDAYTTPGMVVLDPFAGFGTTVVVAERMGRQGWGLEYDARRAAYARSRLAAPDRLIHGDARFIRDYDLPPVDFAMSSPPYMLREDIENPLTAYTTPGAGYEAYLGDLRSVYAQLAARLTPAARVVIEVANLKSAAGVTPLAWDVARAVGDVLALEGEIVIGWDVYGYGYDHSYALVFRKAVFSF